MSEAIKVGAETQAWCTSCRDMQWHVIVAMVGPRPAKVECIHCHKQHLFRASPPGAPAAKDARDKPARASGSSTARSTRKAASAVVPETIDLAPLIAGREPRPYSPASAFVIGDVVGHSTFGVGVVVLLPGPQKMEVAFSGGQKLLAHGRGSVATAAPLARPAPRVDDGTRHASDAPPGAVSRPSRV